MSVLKNLSVILLITGLLLVIYGLSLDINITRYNKHKENKSKSDNSQSGSVNTRDTKNYFDNNVNINNVKDVLSKTDVWMNRLK